MINYNLAQILSKEVLREADNNRLVKIATQSWKIQIWQQLNKFASHFGLIQTLRSEGN